MSWVYVVGVCRGCMSWVHVVGACRGYMSWVYVVGTGDSRWCPYEFEVIFTRSDGSRTTHTREASLFLDDATLFVSSLAPRQEPTFVGP